MIDCISKPFISKIIKNRLSNAIAFTDSTTFYGIEKIDPEIRKDKQNAIEAHKKDLKIIKTDQGTTYTIEINEDGIQEFLQIIKQPLFNEKGFVNGIIGLINDVTEHELLKKKLQEQAVTDALL